MIKILIKIYNGFWKVMEILHFIFFPDDDEGLI